MKLLNIFQLQTVMAVFSQLYYTFTLCNQIINKQQKKEKKNGEKFKNVKIISM